MLIEVEKLDKRVEKAIELVENLSEDNRRLAQSVKQLQADLKTRKKVNKEGRGGTGSDIQKMSKVANVLQVERKTLLRRLEEILKKLETIT